MLDSTICFCLKIINALQSFHHISLQTQTEARQGDSLLLKIEKN